jgi:hypothetical protein
MMAAAIAENRTKMACLVFNKKVQTGKMKRDRARSKAALDEAQGTPFFTGD